MNNYTAYPLDYNSNKKLKTSHIRKTCNRVGFVLLLSTLAFNVVSVLIIILYAQTGHVDVTGNTGISGIPYTLYYIMNAITEFSAFCLVPILACVVLSTKLTDTLPFNNNKKDNTLLLILAGYSICTISNFAVTILNSNLDLFGYENTVGITLSAETPIDKIAFFICIAIVPALSEEFMFRGFILHSLRKHGDGFAIIISAGLFGLVHGNFVQIPFAFIVGLVCGYLVVHTNSMLPAILLHLLNNGTSVLLDIVRTSTDSNTYVIISNMTILTLTLAGFISIILLTKKGLSIKLEPQNTFTGNEKMSLKLKGMFTNPGMIIAIAVSLLEAIGVFR